MMYVFITCAFKGFNYLTLQRKPKAWYATRNGKRKLIQSGKKGERKEKLV